MNANKQDAGGLPELPEPKARLNPWPAEGGDGEPLFAADQMRAYGELCRAAPAGGEPKAPVFPSAVGPVIHEVGQAMWLLPDGADKARARLKNAMDLLRALQHIPPVDSAPAGSGEVADEVMKIANFFEGVRVFVTSREKIKHPEGTDLFDEHVTRLLRVAALLRKLQQPAEEDAYVIEKMGRLLAEIAIIVNGPEPALTKWSYHDLPEKVRKLQQGADYVMVPREPTEAMRAAFTAESMPGFAAMTTIRIGDFGERYRYMIAASQGQEGGHAEG